jgi:hypothetical protein
MIAALTTLLRRERAQTDAHLVPLAYAASAKAA